MNDYEHYSQRHYSANFLESMQAWLSKENNNHHNKRRMPRLPAIWSKLQAS
jgi:hypothetical protein